MDRCIENQYDAKQIFLKSMIAEVGEERIREVWKITDMHPENKKYIHFVIVIVSLILFRTFIRACLIYSAALFITITSE